MNKTHRLSHRAWTLMTRRRNISPLKLPRRRPRLRPPSGLDSGAERWCAPEVWNYPWARRHLHPLRPGAAASTHHQETLLPCCSGLVVGRWDRSLCRPGGAGATAMIMEGRHFEVGVEERRGGWQSEACLFVLLPPVGSVLRGRGHQNSSSSLHRQSSSARTYLSLSGVTSLSFPFW